MDKLSYPNDISDIKRAVKVLQSPKVGFADTDEQITLEEAAGLLTLEELKIAAREIAMCSGGRNKVEMIEALKKSTNGQVGLKSKGGKIGLSYDEKGRYVGGEMTVVEKVLKRTGEYPLNPGVG